MADELLPLFDATRPDPWRDDVSFSPEVATANEALFKPGLDDAGVAQVLAAWLQKHQPCLFGRFAAREDLITYCVLREDDLKSDALVRDKIQQARSEWGREGYEGRKSGFILFVLSPRLARAVPDRAMLAFSQRLCSLYLVRDVLPDQIFHDEILLEKPGLRRTTWKWLSGVNYFSANGDGRWWRDHRIPGGMAFSTNSVGHLAKAGRIAEAIADMDRSIGAPSEDLTATRVNSLERALEIAMRTIDMAAPTPWGRATELLPCDPAAKCPIKLPPNLEGKEHRSYRGGYHTDFTLPSEYFVERAERPSELPYHSLDFSYLFDSSIENPDFVTMGIGRRVRLGGPDESAEQPRVVAATPLAKLNRFVPVEVELDEELRRRLKL